MPPYLATSARIAIRRPTPDDCAEFIALIQTSRPLHHPWVDFADTPDRYAAYLRSRQSGQDDGFLLCERSTHRIAGLVNLNCIVRGAFQSTYLGYGIGLPFAGQGYMTEGLRLTTHYAFTELALHRAEANIQPANTRSIELVKRCGFQREGFSPRYLKINGQWRDHERWALLAD